MRYIHTNIDGSVAIWATLPKQIIRNSDGEVFTSVRLIRKNGKTWLFGGNARDRSCEISFDGEDVDVSDLPVDAVEGYTLVFPDFETDIRDKLHPNEKAKVASHRRIFRNELIEDRTFRGAWRDNGQVHVDMPLAREIQRDRIRKVREGLLGELDTAYMRADEQNDNQKKAQVAQEKQRLRDFTTNPAIDAAQTPEELKVILPTIEITL